MPIEKYCVFHIDGGIGKHVAATAVAQCIKNNHPDRKLIVVAAWPAIFLNLQFVDRVYKQGNTPYFYQDFIQNKDTLLFKHEPYFSTDHVHGTKSLIENWCNIYNLEYSSEVPQLLFNMRQKQLANKWLFNNNKPTLLIHSAGGMYADDTTMKYKWSRDMPPHVMERIYAEFFKTHNIIQVVRKNGIKLPNVRVVDQPLPTMELFSLLLNSDKRVLIDSCMQHAAAALKLSSTVLWIGTNPKIFGYSIHNNIVANKVNKQQLPDSYLFDYSFDGTVHECPYMNETEMFCLDTIIETIKKQERFNEN